MTAWVIMENNPRCHECHSTAVSTSPVSGWNPLFPQGATVQVPAALLGGNPCNRYCEGVTSAAGVATETRRPDHLGKSGLSLGWAALLEARPSCWGGSAAQKMQALWSVGPAPRVQDPLMRS